MTEKYVPPKVHPPKGCTSCDGCEIDHPLRYWIDDEGRPVWPGNCLRWKMAGRKSARTTTAEGKDCESYRWIQGRRWR